MSDGIGGRHVPFVDIVASEKRWGAEKPRGRKRGVGKWVRRRGITMMDQRHSGCVQIGVSLYIKLIFNHKNFNSQPD